MQSQMIVTTDKKTVLSQSFAAKFSSKKEVYNFLTREVKAYLPPPDCVHILFLRDIVQGKK